MIDIYFEDVSENLELTIDFFEVWLSKVVDIEKKTLGDVTLIFTSDEYLLKVNQEHLDHDYYTDIITFDYSEDDFVSGDLFISIDRVKENAEINNVSFLNELNRVVVHGVLHLCGYKDKSEDEERLMRSKENQMLDLI
jgi:probable rRNA maturation factor